MTETLREIEDQEIRQAVRLQEQLGLAVVTDGEFRRLNFQDSFGESVAGYDAAKASVRVYEHRVKGSNPLQRWENPSSGESKGTAVSLRHPAVERLRLTKNTPLDEFRFLSQVAQRPAKVTLIGPDRISQRFDLQKSRPVYADIDEFVTDVVNIEREMIRGLIEAGCRYIQIDAPGYTAYVDLPSLQRMRERGEDPKQNFTRSLKADNELFLGFDEVTFGIHLCRGNQRSMWHREGTYDAIAERLLNELKHDRFLFDMIRLGPAALNRFVFCPKAKSSCLAW